MNRIYYLPLTLILAACSPAADQSALPAHPGELVFAEAVIEIPDANQYKHDMGNGNVAYVVEDHSLPLVKIGITSHAGRYLLPNDDSGLAGITSSMLRDGGTTDLSPEDFDERLDFLASSISASIGMMATSATLNSLSDNLDETLDLLFDMITEPRFDAERLSIHKSRVLESMKRRNDDTRSIEPRYWNELMRGEGFFTALQANQAQVEAIDAERMMALTKQAFTNGNLVISVSGDINAMEIVAKLNEQLSRLPGAVELPEIPDVPLLLDLATTDEQRGMIRFLAAGSPLGRAAQGPPGIPKARFDALTNALAETLKDPAFLAKAKKRKLVIAYTSREDTIAAVRTIMETPAPTVARIKAVLGYK